MVSLAGTIERVLEKITKEDVGLDLPELEEAARLTLQEEEEEKTVNNLVVGLTSVRVSEAVDSDDDSEEGSTDSEESDSVEE